MSTLAKLYTSDGPFVSAYLDTQAVTHDATRQLDLRRRALGDDLRALGADEGTVEAVLAAVRKGPGTEAQALVASHGQVLLDRHLPLVVDQEVGWWGPLPYVLPVVTADQARVPHVVVLVNRKGGDILAYDGGDSPARTEVVKGSHDVIVRHDQGGLSQKRYQDRALDSWAGNAKEVAEQVGRIVDDVRARLVLVNGDVQAVQYLLDYLPEHVRPLASVIEEGGGRAVDGSADVVADAVVARVADKAVAEMQELVEKFQEERGQHDKASDGVAGTVSSLMRAEVATLLLVDDQADRRTAWFGPEPVHVALDAQTLRDLGVADPVQARLPDVLVRSALGTGADVCVVPAGVPSDGVGALLRW